jgi:hypothetical protein
MADSTALYAQVRLLLRPELPKSQADRDHLASTLIAAAARPGVVLVRLEGTLRTQGIQVVEGGAYVVLSCARDEVEGLAETMSDVGEVDTCQVVTEPPCFVAMWMAREYAWGGVDAARRHVHADVAAALEEFRVRAHVVFVSEGSGYCCVEMRGDQALQAAQSLCRQVCVSICGV